KVFAVIGIEFFYQAGADCVARQFRTPLITSEGPGDDVYTRAAPLLFSLQPSEDRLLHNFVQWAERKGLFNGAKIGLYYSTYPSGAYQGTLAMTTVRRGEPAAGIPLSSQEEACVTNYERYSGKKISRPGPKGHELAQWVFVVLACDESNVLLHALQNAGRNLTQATFVAGLQGIHNLPLIRYPNVTWGPGKFQGVDSQRTLQWTSDCTCWRAQGQFAPLFL